EVGIKDRLAGDSFNVYRHLHYIMIVKRYPVRGSICLDEIAIETLAPALKVNSHSEHLPKLSTFARDPNIEMTMIYTTPGAEDI
ncbi:hypothetical protein Q8G71_36145, partial [Klebsiella pneumoniae]